MTNTQSPETTKLRIIHERLKRTRDECEAVFKNAEDAWRLAFKAYVDASRAEGFCVLCETALVNGHCECAAMASDIEPAVTKTISLTDQQYEMLLDVLDSYRDCGPEGESWASPEVLSLRAVIREVEPEQKPCTCGPTYMRADCPRHGDPAALTGAARPTVGGVEHVPVSDEEAAQIDEAVRAGRITFAPGWNDPRCPECGQKIDNP